MNYTVVTAIENCRELSIKALCSRLCNCVKADM